MVKGMSDRESNRLAADWSNVTDFCSQINGRKRKSGSRFHMTQSNDRNSEVHTREFEAGSSPSQKR